MKCCAVLMYCAWLALPLTAFAHGTEGHDARPAQIGRPSAEQTTREAGDATAPAAPVQTPTAIAPKVAAPGEGEAQKSEAVGAERRVGGPLPQRAQAQLSIETVIRDLNFADFPTLHPMAVHVPVTFIPLALLFALLAVFSARRSFTGLAFGFTLGGVAGGVVAAFPLHPHTTGLSAAARETLHKHDFFAYATLWLGLLAALVGLACLWKPSLVRRLLLCLVLLLASLAVAVTAHYGGTLAYLHGIGVQGRYLNAH